MADCTQGSDSLLEAINQQVNKLDQDALPSSSDQVAPLTTFTSTNDDPRSAHSVGEGSDTIEMAEQRKPPKERSIDGEVHEILEQCQALDTSSLLTLTLELFTKITAQSGGDFQEFVGSDFLLSSLEAAEVLFSSSASNVLLRLAKVLQTERLATESAAFCLIESFLLASENNMYDLGEFPDKLKTLLTQHKNTSVVDFLNVVVFPSVGQKFTCNKKDAVNIQKSVVKLERCDGDTRRQDHMMKQPVKCTFCGEVFQSRDEWKTHVTSHVSQSCHICTTCGKSFNRSKNLSRHVKSVHENIKAFTCSTCKRSFTERVSLNDHMRLHTGEKPFPCKLCRQTFRTRRLYVKHLYDEHGLSAKDVKAEEVFPCTLCDKTFGRRSNLDRHVRSVHNGVRDHACKTCNQRFTDQSSLQEHERIHTGEKPFACDQCDDKFRTRGLYHRHVAFRHGNKHTQAEPIVSVSTKKLPCRLCDKRFKRKDNLQKHVKAIHENKRSFVCNICTASFREQGAFDDHTRIHTGEKPYLCTKCPESFRTRELYRKHVAASHGFICDFCGAKFRNASSLGRHRSRDHGSQPPKKPFKCVQCAKAFKFRYLRERHFLQIHRGIKKHLCKVCGRRTNNLIEHMATHERRIRFSCELCGEGFVHRASYKRHVIRHQGLQQFGCSLCAKRFDTPYYLQTHLTKVHKSGKDAPVQLPNQFKMPAAYLLDSARQRRRRKEPEGYEESAAVVQILPVDPATSTVVRHLEVAQPLEAPQNLGELEPQSVAQVLQEQYSAVDEGVSYGPWGDHQYQAQAKVLPQEVASQREPVVEIQAEDPQQSSDATAQQQHHETPQQLQLLQLECSEEPKVVTISALLELDT